MKSDLISVIVPAYNIENYISRAIDSILNQTYKNIEIIVVDDGSADGTGNIIDEYAKLYQNKVIAVHTENKGVTNARLEGLKKASGEWIGFVDGDDETEQDMYELLLDNAKKYNADISHCGYQMVFPDRTDFYYNTGKIIKQNRQEALKSLLEGVYIEPSLGNKLIKTALLKTFVMFQKMDMTVKNNEDLLMNFYLFGLADTIIYEDFCPYHYMIRKNSAATASLSERKLADSLKVQKILYSETENNRELNDIVKRRLLMTLINLSSMLFYKNAEFVKQYKKQAKKELRRLLFSVLKGNYSFKQKILALWCSVWAESYGAVHQLYAKLSGIDKKYEIK